MNNYVSYLRVSTQKQGRSQLGLDAQRTMCQSFVATHSGFIVQEFIDVESGTHRNRKGLWDAIECCKTNGYSLVIAKLDRLARDVEFTFKVINTGIDIHFVDMPVVNSMILGVFASVAQYERELISDRTKKALAVVRKRGVKVGASSDKYQERFNQKTQQEKQEFYAMRGSLKKEHFQNSPDFKAFARILRNVFPDHTTEEDISQWVWQGMNCKAWHLEKMLKMIYDYQAIDSTLFKKFNGTESDKKRLRAHFQAFRRSIIGK